MTNEEFKKLRVGDFINHRLEKTIAYIVVSNLDGKVLALPVTELTNPADWQLDKSIEDFN